jgi:hypothetical protein
VTPISPGEIKGVLGFFKLNSSDSVVVTSIAKIGNFLLNFGWSLAEGKKRAKIIIVQLEKLKIISLLPGKGREVRLKISDAKDSESLNNVTPKLIKKVPVTDVSVLPPVKYFSKPTKIPKLKKGVVRRKREAVNKGDRNEQRLHNLMLGLLRILKEKFPENILETSCFRSGRHNPSKGKIDLQDRSGEDISPKLTVRDREGRIITGRLILDAKSSAISARKFNSFIHFLPGQEGALLKKAIVVNKHRPDSEINAEILKDLSSVGLISEIQVSAALQFLGDF